MPADLDAATAGRARGRWRLALRRPANWVQLAKFATVGGVGYVVNLGLYSVLVLVLDVHYLAAAFCSFLVAVTNNYTWNRLWTFRRQRGHLVYQGVRFLLVSTVALAANLVFLRLLVALELHKVLAQGIAIVLVTPWNFAANKLWSFRR
ncbi:MAG: GtrA family protein [Thermoleophilia bacterium]|nr:GtrA family protein [Thermoleophilia bacterium]